MHSRIPFDHTTHTKNITTAETSMRKCFKPNFMGREKMIVDIVGGNKVHNINNEHMQRVHL